MAGTNRTEIAMSGTTCSGMSGTTWTSMDGTITSVWVAQHVPVYPAEVKAEIKT